MNNISYVKESKILRPLDIILVLVITTMVILAFTLALPKDDGNIVEIYLEGELLYRLQLGIDKVIKLDNVGYVIIENNTVRVKDIDCPDKLCEQQGAISKSGQSIICLPNKLIVLVDGQSEWDVIV